MEKRFLELLPRDRLESKIDDLKPAYTSAQAVAEANRCIYCFDAPCVNACPTHINIPEFIRKIAVNNVTGAAKTILTANILGFSCARVCPVEVLCVGDCVYNNMGIPPIQIGKLQRYATDGIVEKDVRFWEKGAPTGKKVAFVGAGPASLAAAHELTRLGHHCVIFDGRALPGGLNTTGVAPYKIRTEDVLKEVEYVTKIGIELRLGKWVGWEAPLADVEKEFDAIFLGIGLGLDSTLRGAGAKKLKGVRGAVDFIEELKNKPSFDLGNVKCAAVIGGGNTALDVVRELKKLGVPRVVMVYRRSESEMGGYKHEYDWAKKEGVEFAYLALPTDYVGTDAVTSVRCVRTEIADEGGRRVVKPVPGSEFNIAADLVIEAIGQGKLEKLYQQIQGLELSKGCPVVNPQTGQTSNPKYFAGGDCVNGGKEVVNAVEEGKIAAAGIHKYLTGGA